MMLTWLLRQGFWLAWLLGTTMAAVAMVETDARGAYSLDRPFEVDAVVVLGGGSDPDGHLNWRGRERVETGVAALRQGKARYVIISGGGNAGPFWAEGHLFRAYALSLGAPPSRVLIEPYSRTTLENLRFTFAMGDALGLQSYAIATNAFHLPRALMLARALGRPEAIGIAADGPWEVPWYTQIGGLMREAMAWWYNVAKVLGWWALGALGKSEAERGEIIQ